MASLWGLVGSLLKQSSDPAKRAEELASAVAHDLRNPLSCVQGYADFIITRDPPREERDRLLERILSCSRFMEQVIENLLDSSALEHGRMSLNMTRVRVEALLREALEAMEHTAAARGVALELEAPEAASTVRADPTRLRQVIQNLVSNAIRHVPAGSGRVVIAVTESQGRLEVEVRDNGEGIAADQLERIFGKFRGEDGSRSRGSLGLGLFIARSIAELHGGRLWAESAGKGRGARLRLTLPLFEPETAYEEHKALRRCATPPPRTLPAASW